ncbi:hypothetical protein [Melaminivora alkalimesophila]|uniref:Phosphoglycerate mutase n=1 Tax=Melaminivora alkalimesophila TaxID=1165852 RepID=A0A317RF79_9BURK|nr:hypothetical protein [Melaminivora alkalimesophila]PWW48549.1 hypothetical protein DFR36_10151 [Melaminivora alkalimesophila]
MSDTDHLLIPFAASHAPGCRQALATLALPQLSRLLALLGPGTPDPGAEDSFSPPHERALARHLGLPDGPQDCPAWAAWAVRQQPEPPEDPSGGWAWVTPCHWQVGMDQVSMDPPERLGLDEADSRALLEVLAPWFAQDGITLAYHAPDRWLARGALFDGLATASLDRVVGRDVRPWLPDKAAGRTLHRLHSEVQMLLYTHPFNEARIAQGALPVNAFWVHGAGALASPPPSRPLPQMPDALREAALREDWPAWAEAWRALDAGPVARWLARARAGTPVRLTLCGERGSWEGSNARRGIGARLRALLAGDRWPALYQQL